MIVKAVPEAPVSVREAAKALIRLYIPGANEEESLLRARINLAQATAAKRRDRSISADAARLYALASSISCTWCLRSGVGQDELSEIIKLLTWLFLAAGALERLERSDG